MKSVSYEFLKIRLNYSFKVKIIIKTFILSKIRVFTFV